MRRNVIGFIAFNFILRRIFRGVVCITFIIKIFFLCILIMVPETIPASAFQRTLSPTLNFVAIKFKYFYTDYFPEGARATQASVVSTRKVKLSCR